MATNCDFFLALKYYVIIPIITVSHFIMARTSISLDDEVMNAAKIAGEKQNEDRDFSSLCEVALREFLVARGYMQASKDEEAREILSMLAAAIKKAPALKAQLRKIAAKAVRMNVAGSRA